MSPLNKKSCFVQIFSYSSFHCGGSALARYSQRVGGSCLCGGTDLWCRQLVQQWRIQGQAGHAEPHHERVAIDLTSPRGLNGDLDSILFPINHGILHFVGFDALPPFVAWAVARSTPEQRQEYLKCFEERLRDWQSATPIAYIPWKITMKRCN